MDGVERRAGAAVEDEDEAHFGGDGDGGGGVAEGEEEGLGGDVVVPEVVVDDLEGPDLFAGGGVEGDEGVGVSVVAGAETSVVVGRGGAGGEIEEVEGGVGGDDGPGVGGAGAEFLVFGPGNGLPGPELAAGLGIVGADEAGLGVDLLVVADAGADDDDVPDDGGGRGHAVEAVFLKVNALLEVDFSVGTEVGAGLAGAGVEGEEAGVEGCDEDAGLRFGVPEGDAAGGDKAPGDDGGEPGVVGPSARGRWRRRGR